MHSIHTIIKHHSCLLLYAKKKILKEIEIESKIEQNKTNQTILIQEEQQQQQQQEEAPTEPESNGTQEQDDQNNVDSISQKSAQINGNHRENGSANNHQEDANTNDDINHNKEITNPSVMEIEGIVQGEADNNVVQSASRFSAVDDEDNKV